jgi:hypothetical protein
MDPEDEEVLSNPADYSTVLHSVMEIDQENESKRRSMNAASQWVQPFLDEVHRRSVELSSDTLYLDNVVSK